LPGGSRGLGDVYKRQIEVVDFPAFILVDDKGNDFFLNLPAGCGVCAT
jgi:tartrate dehydratase beta subunit/fumarate hydratase class I family protein